MKKSLDQFIQTAKQRGYVGKYDSSNAAIRWESVLSEIKIRCKASIETAEAPGNDLYCHSVGIETPRFTFKFFIRLDEEIYLIDTYIKGAHGILTWTPTAELHRGATTCIARTLVEMGLEEVQRSIFEFDLGKAPIEAGMNGSSLFCQFFED